MRWNTSSARSSMAIHPGASIPTPAPIRAIVHLTVI
jgi:hypothetical protein